MIRKTYNINIYIILCLIMVIIFIASGCSSNDRMKTSEGQKKDFVLATTTSTQDSGLLDVLVPTFEEQSGFMVKTIAVGTGKALEMGENGEADALLVHAPESEQPLVDSGVATNYQLVMHNDFIVVGPKEDPAGIKGLATSVEAFKKMAEINALFVSRGDDSGTHKKELGLWKNAGVEPNGKWYQETGQGMGATLKVASEKGGYSLTDRATYLALKDELNLEIVLQGEESLLNIYHVMQVNPEKFENINGEAGKAFVDFMVAPETQKVIGEFGVDEYGEPLFFPDANTK